MYNVDFTHQFIETEKYDTKPTYKKFLGYRPGMAVIGDLIVGIENSDGNTNVPFHDMFSRQGITRSSSVLLIWLNENVRSAHRFWTVGGGREEKLSSTLFFTTKGGLFVC